MDRRHGRRRRRVAGRLRRVRRDVAERPARRIVDGAVFRRFWDRLCSSLQVGIHCGDHDDLLLSLLAVPVGLQQEVLRVLTDDYRSVVALARLWHSTAKLASPEYAIAVGQDVITEFAQLHWDAGSTPRGSSTVQVVEVPTVSGNALRHQIVREPAWLHLCEHLGLEEKEPGKGPVPAGVEAIFYNGGNIAAGAKQPSNVFALAAKIRQMYPSLDLLGGVTDSFDLGESRLQVAGWLVCAENREALRGSLAYHLPAATISAFDLLDDVTMTRQASPQGVGQMIMSFETLCPGTQVLVRFGLQPFTPVRTRGALEAAVETFRTNGPSVGGQAARGFGHCQMRWLTEPDNGEEALEQYEEYLANNAEQLAEWLMDGTLGTGVRVIS